MSESTSVTSPRERVVAEQMEDMPPVDAARLLASLDVEDAAAVAEYLAPEAAARIIAELEPETAGLIFTQMERPEAAMVLMEMDPDDRVDVLDEVEDDVHDQLVAELDPVERDEVATIEAFEPDSAGGIMTTEVTALYEYLTVGDAIEQIRKLQEEFEQLFYTYVIDTRGHLVGVLSMRDLILARPTTQLREIMIKNARSVPATMDQEEVARLMTRYGYLAMPVVDERNRLIGLITADDVQDVMQEEAYEDVQKMFGAGAEERLSSPWQLSFRQRVWWLVVNLGTAFMASMVVGAFEGTIAKLALLAAYMPIVAGMGGNASAQAMAVSVRGIAIGHFDRRILKHVIRRELIVGVLTGLIIGTITAIVAIIFHTRDVGFREACLFGGVVATALIFNHSLACTTGAAIPFIMKRMGFDPAQSATIFATTVTDVCGFFALLGLAYWILV